MRLSIVVFPLSFRNQIPNPLITSLSTKHLSIMNRGAVFLMWLLPILRLSSKRFKTYQFIVLLLIFRSAFSQTTTRPNAHKTPFSTFLKSKGQSYDIRIPNLYETIQNGNKYSNFYFNFKTDLPDNWSIDRGASIGTVIRAFSADSGSQISFNAFPLNSINGERKYQDDPLIFLKDGDREGYFNILKKGIIEGTTIQNPYDFKLSRKKIRTVDYAVLSYKCKMESDGVELEFTMIQFQTNLWDTIYTILYNSPSFFYNEGSILDVLENTVYAKPSSLLYE